MQNSLRRHSVESTGSAVREFNAYHQYRQQLQSQSMAPDTSGTSDDRNVAAPKHHNPGVEASNSSRDRLAPSELRQRVCSLNLIFRFCFFFIIIFII